MVVCSDLLCWEVEAMEEVVVMGVARWSHRPQLLNPLLREVILMRRLLLTRQWSGARKDPDIF